MFSRGPFLIGALLAVLLLAGAAAAGPPAPQDPSVSYDPDERTYTLTWSWPGSDPPDASVVYSKFGPKEGSAVEPIVWTRVEAPYEGVRKGDGRYVYEGEARLSGGLDGSRVYLDVRAEADGQEGPASEMVRLVPWEAPGAPRNPRTDVQWGGGRYSTEESEVRVCVDEPDVTGGSLSGIEVYRRSDGGFSLAGESMGTCWTGDPPIVTFGGTEVFQVRATNAAGTGPATEAVLDYGYMGLFRTGVVLFSLGCVGVAAYRYLPRLLRN